MAAGTLVLVLAAVSCSTVNRAVVVLPEVPGAKYIGSKECEQCHEELYRDFVTADHARLMAEGTNASTPGASPATARQPARGLRRRNQAALQFRRRPPANEQLRRAVAGPACPRDRNRLLPMPPDVRGQFELPTHHPVPEGRLTCTACHSPHKGSITTAAAPRCCPQNESCLRCHADQRGPYVFEHDAVREGCTTCQTPHGSVNAKLLSVRDANLCLKCHFQQVSGGQLLIGGSDHTLRVRQGTCWTAGCHTAVHGSRVSPSLRF